ncbi:MAG: cobalamin-binding protein [Acidobacteria bacterium]|nr:cobalamin-binding protein [Acidobacteriota bacterium]
MTHRIVSLISSATEIVCALGFEDDLVGRSHECDYPPSIVQLPACSTSKVHLDAAGQAIDSQVRSIVADGLSVYRVDPDLLNELAPTVIVTQTQCDVCAVSLSDVERAVCELVTSQPAIVTLEPMGLGDIWSDIRKVAAALRAPERGDALVARLEGRLDAVRAAVPHGGPRPSIACVEWIEPLMMAANWVPELVDCAGGENRFGEAGKHSGYLDAEVLFAADPDVIAVMPCGFDIDRAWREMQPLAGRPEWSRLQAVRNGRVVMCDGNQYFNRPGPRVVESAEILAECLHPDSCDFGHRGRGWRPYGLTATVASR